jgi:hypothetical protein
MGRTQEGTVDEYMTLTILAAKLGPALFMFPTTLKQSNTHPVMGRFKPGGATADTNMSLWGNQSCPKGVKTGKGWMDVLQV